MTVKSQRRQKRPGVCDAGDIREVERLLPGRESSRSPGIHILLFSRLSSRRKPGYPLARRPSPGGLSSPRSALKITARTLRKPHVFCEETRLCRNVSIYSSCLRHMKQKTGAESPAASPRVNEVETVSRTDCRQSDSPSFTREIIPALGPETRAQTFPINVKLEH